ncbi:glucose-1-phosphate adenylyltransferase [Thermogymnomonas acidicola]|uniref:Glucose-1-phosphate adenylyltransferase n=1 Tax=Thermogymnomonas acidicola TaxID=399579 RepID=A0AA37BPG7_9ARCH|nr:nucleotidyltransferase family protein [Thermogymnomonas acidicola]GGM66688.1 glucose-1-phosphate adenylyltransferase [Thermogymnomonas acidicola]
MIGAILAGGYGKRLKPLTDEIPKALVPIKEGYTIMDRQLFDFRVMGIEEVYILSGYLGQKIEERYGDEYMGLKMRYLREERPMGTLFSLRNLISHVRDDIVLRNGDTITDMNMKRFLEYAANSNYQLLMFVVKMKSPYGIVETLGDQVLNFVEKPFLNHFINAGFYYIKREALDIFFEDYHGKDLETTVFPRMARRKMVGAYTEDTLWMGIDSEKDLEQIREEYSNREDMEWGYRKVIFSDGRRTVSEVFVRTGERASVDDGESILRIISGLAEVNGKAVHTGDVILEEGKAEITAYEDTKVEVICTR